MRPIARPRLLGRRLGIALVILAMVPVSGCASGNDPVPGDSLSADSASQKDLTPIKDTVPFPVGAAVSGPQLVGEAGDLLAMHFNQVTPENCMKPEAWYDANRHFVTTNVDADALMDFAKDHQMRVYGHNLLWHQQTPDWFFQDDTGRWLTDSPEDQDLLEQRLHNHIDSVAKYLSDRYGLFGSSTNPVVAFDVANEVIMDGGGMRSSRWYSVLADSYVPTAFKDADEAFNHTYADPSANRPVALFINDYNTEQSSKQKSLVSLVNQLIADNVPVDGIGHQFHLKGTIDVSLLKAAIDAFAGIETATGHPLYEAVTELDIGVARPATNEGLVAQANMYKQIFDMLREEDAAGTSIFSVSIWGLTDNQSWLIGQGWDAPLLFDEHYQAKPAYYGVTDQDIPQ